MPPSLIPRRKLGPGQVLLVASLVFGLYFGAGNLVFPVELGRAAGGNVVPATVGLLITAVGLPLLGLVAAAVSGSSNAAELVRPVGRWYCVGFTCALYLTIGPLFAIPRTATVSFEMGVVPLLGQGHHRLALGIFSGVFFIVTAVASLRPGRLVDLVGRYLTPSFLVLLAAVLGACVISPMPTTATPPSTRYATGPVTSGLIDGYQTMDALASVAFAVVVIDALRRLGVAEKASMARSAAQAGLLAALGMALIYSLLAFVGRTSLEVAPDAANGGAVLAAVTQHYFGGPGLVLIAAIVLAACLKTGIGLTTACAEMFNQLFPGVLPYRGWVLAFAGASALVANLGLAGIVKVSVPVLGFLYPLAITAILLGLLWPWIGRSPAIHQLTTAFVAAAALLDLLRALELPAAAPLLNLASRLLPGFDLGFGWVLPAVVGFVLGALVTSRMAGSSPSA